MSYRELWSLMQHLPEESWTQTILRDKPRTGTLADLPPVEVGPRKFGPWSQHDYLIADLIDAVRTNNYLTAVGARLEPKPKPPEPVARPGLGRPRRRQSDAAVTYLNSLRAKGA